MVAKGQSCSCCAPETIPESILAQGCPRCGVVSQHKVGAITLRALLADSEEDFVNRDDYLLCTTPECPVVYFDSESGAVYTKDQITVRVGFKETDSPRTLCYCFDHTWETMQKEWLAIGQCTTAASIRESIRSEGCRCEETNPKGICCLGDITEALHQIQAQGAERHPR